MNNSSNIVITPKVRSQTHSNAIICILLLLTPLFGMAVDLVAPTLPGIATSLHASHSLVKDVISIYMLGYALGNFVTGFLSDAWGRQKLMRSGLIIFILASITPIILPNITVLLIARLIQGIALGMVAVVDRAIFADILAKDRLIHLGTWMGTMWGLGTVIAPAIGGYLQFYFGYISCFYLFTIIATIALIAVCIVIPETHFMRHPLKIATIQHNLSQIFASKQFMGIIILMGLMYSILVGFHTAAPLLVESTLHHSSIFFGHIALCVGIVFFCSTFVGRVLLKKCGYERLVSTVLYSGLIALVSLLILSYFLGNNIVLLVVTSGIMFFINGCIFPPSMGKGLSLFQHIAGTATSVMFFVAVLTTSLTSFVLSLIHVNTVSSMFVFYVIILTAGIIVYITCLRKSLTP